MGLGIFWAILSAICNGTYGVFAKVPPVQAAQVPPWHFNFWVSVGVVLSSLPLLLVHHVGFTPYGMLSGALFVLSTAHTFFAIKRLGLSVASGIWCGTAVLFSFTFGIRFAGESLSHPVLAAPGLLGLVGGIAGIALNGEYNARLKRGDVGFGGDEDIEARILDPLNSDEEDTSVERMKGFLQGVSAAVAAGAFGGLILAPMNYAPEELQGVQYVPSMACGVLLAAPVITAFIWLITRAPAPDPQQVKTAAAFGALSGVIWNLGNVVSILAVHDPSVGLAIAYPLMQCGLFVAGIWGIVLFRELEPQAQPGYWFSGIVLITGATLLTSSK